MLSVQKQPRYLRKKIQLPNGAWAYVVFELVENGGKITAKAIYGELVESKVSGEKILSLPVYFETQHITPIVSPFFAEVKILIKDLAFIVSQPTRAPSF